MKGLLHPVRRLIPRRLEFAGTTLMGIAERGTNAEVYNCCQRQMLLLLQKAFQESYRAEVLAQPCQSGNLLFYR